ncbi:MAG: M20 family metallopeptidase [Synergistaceae bacterium]|jgi:amidohydrolase|nr:M20 family metallopeptidase [Synergistaceae bacterium]
MKDMIFEFIDGLRDGLAGMADEIFDNPEIGYAEHRASALLTSYLKNAGFSVEVGAGGLETAFRAAYRLGSGGPSIGLLCEYDAIEGTGHACAHHIQGPAVVGAAAAAKELLREKPFQLVVYGTPAEETSGGKIDMLEYGCFRDIDVALMCHGSPTTTTDIKCLAMSSFHVSFKGVSSHAAISPEAGRSALDAILLSCHGVEFLREHVPDDVRMHYTILNAGGPENVVPQEASARFVMRSYDRDSLDSVVDRFKKIIAGASQMTETEYSIIEEKRYDSKIPVLSLNELLIENARLVNAPCIRPPREQTGSTDFGNVMYVVPGSCIRVAFVPEGTPPHSQTYIDAGKSREAHEAVTTAAKIIAATIFDLVSDEGALERVTQEFESKKKAALALG